MKETRIILRRVGRIDPLSLEAYAGEDGYAALRKAVQTMTPEEVLETVIASGLRGRGGAGFPTGRKWSFVAAASGTEKVIVCNADESEPGTFKDRLILEGDPYAVLEGMALAGYAVGAREGWIYIRGEYAEAARRLETAIERAYAAGFLGEHILDTAFTFHIHLHRGAGAYICGEETALLESLEGKRGIPRVRPPYPTVAGYHGLPTVVNNVETLANVAPIVLQGAEWYRALGVANSPGTKIFTLSGDVAHPGAIEVPMGVTLRQLIELAGGMQGEFKCAQTGGAAGTIVAADKLDRPLTFDSLREDGLSLGSGAILVCNRQRCVVDLAYVLMRFFKNESCGKCTPCRVGTLRLFEILERLRRGRGEAGDLERLEQFGRYVRDGSFCGLGQAAPTGLLTALHAFREEFEAHLGGVCPTDTCPMQG